MEFPFEKTVHCNNRADSCGVASPDDHLAYWNPLLSLSAFTLFSWTHTAYMSNWFCVKECTSKRHASPNLTKGESLFSRKIYVYALTIPNSLFLQSQITWMVISSLTLNYVSKERLIFSMESTNVTKVLTRSFWCWHGRVSLTNTELKTRPALLLTKDVMHRKTPHLSTQRLRTSLADCLTKN